MITMCSPIISVKDLKHLRNTCCKCNRLMLHAEDRTAYSLDNISMGIHPSHYCRPNLIPKVTNMTLDVRLPKQPECMYKIGSVF